MEKNLIKIVDEVKDWKEAIKLGVELLSANNFCTQELEDKIIESVNKHGPYFIIMPQVALAHASPGPYAKEVGLSLIKFEKQVKFSEEDRHKVFLLFTLSAIDGESHMNILMKFSELFMSRPNLLDEIKSKKTVDEIYELLKEI